MARNLSLTGLLGSGSKVPRRRMAFEEEIAKAVTFERDEALNKAEDIYRDILTRDPNHVEAARLLAGIAVKNKRYYDAEVFLLRVVFGLSQRSRFHLGIGEKEFGQKIQKISDCLVCVLKMFISKENPVVILR
jgi:hypothetical protein